MELGSRVWSLEGCSVRFSSVDHLGQEKRREEMVRVLRRGTYPRNNRIVAREMRLAVLAAEYLVRVEVGVVNEAHAGRSGPK